ncbi:hypothetical protein COM12_26485 [Bacillus wiedmannii]|nr:hypothetical protein [Bacillus wiedmannii]PGB61305.1 hypothetical protein COM12_26485 [Bacillus wiedmannii]
MNKIKIIKEELIKLVKKCNFKGTKDEISEYIDILKENVPYPKLGDIIFWNSKQLSPEEIVDEALNCKEEKQ